MLHGNGGVVVICQRASSAKDFGEENLDSDLNCDTEKDIESTDQCNLEPPAPPSSLLFSHRERLFAMLFDTNGQVRSRAVKYKEGERRHQIEDQSDAQGAQYLDFQWIVRPNQYRPGKIEEEEIKRSAIRGEGGDDQEGQGWNGH